MFESIINFLKRIGKSEKEQVKSKDAAKERLHLVLMQESKCICRFPRFNEARNN